MELSIEDHWAAYRIVKGTGGSLSQYLQMALSPELERVPLMLGLMGCGGATGNRVPTPFEVLECIYKLGAEELEGAKADLMSGLAKMGVHPMSLFLACNRSNHPVYLSLLVSNWRPGFGQPVLRSWHPRVGNCSMESPGGAPTFPADSRGCNLPPPAGI